MIPMLDTLEKTWLLLLVSGNRPKSEIESNTPGGDMSGRRSSSISFFPNLFFFCLVLCSCLQFKYHKWPFRSSGAFNGPVDVAYDGSDIYAPPPSPYRKPISLISHSDVRYRGILAGIDPAASTIQLSNGTKPIDVRLKNGVC
jgi:hypothetical protein